MKGKIFVLLLCATIALGTGVSVAYYNTRTFGFDKDAKVVEKFDDILTSIMTMQIKF